MVSRRRRVVWTDHARDTLNETLAYIAQDSPVAARRIAGRLIEEAATLVTLFERGRIVPELEDPTIRELLVHPFRLIYEVDASEVRVLTVVAILLPALSLACGAVTEPRVERRPAIIEFHSDPVVIAVPDTVTARSSFTVSVRTYGGGCISQGDTEVAIEGLLAVIRPFDLELTGPDVVCTEELRLFEHVATVRFDQTGTGTVRVLGRREPGNESLSADRTIVVR